MSTRFRPSSRNLLGGKFWNEFLDWGRVAYRRDIANPSLRQVFAEGAPLGHVKTTDAQQLKLLREARMQGSPMYTQSRGAQARLAQLEAKEAQRGST